MRRYLPILAAAALGWFSASGQAQAVDSMTFAMAPQVDLELAPPSSRISEGRDWRDYFQDISRGGIVISIDDARLSYWSPGAEKFMEFPIGAPKAEEFERTGRTQVVRKKVDPDWRPTADMRRRDPSLPAYMPPGPANPLGTRAMYLGWPAFLIHGTNAPMTIGRKVSSGCFRMFPQHAELLFDYVDIGTPVYVH